MDICIVYELNNREFYNSVLLERELIRRGHRVKVCNKTENINVFKSYDITLVPNSYNTADVLNYRYVFNTRNNPIVIYPYEQLINHNVPKVFDISGLNIVKNMPHLCWGEDYYNWSREALGLRNNLSCITGAIQLDLYRPQFRELYLSKEEMAKKFNLPIDKKWILFISDFVFINEARIRHTIEAGAIDSEFAYALKEFESKSVDKLAEWFGKFLMNHKDYVIIYRKHPTEIITDQIEKVKEATENLFLISDLSINEWIMNCDIITTWDSTAVVECYVAGKKVALLRPYQFTSDIKKHENELYYDYVGITVYDQFVDCMLNEIPDYTDGFKKRVGELYSFSHEKPSFIRVADALEEISNHYKRETLEKNYEIMRLIHLLRHNIFLKLPIKALFKKYMSLSNGKTPAIFQKRRLAVSEWTLSARNMKMKKTIEKKMDSILQQSY